MLNNEPQHSRVVFIVTASCSLGFLKGQLGYLQRHEFDVTVISSGGLEQESARHEGASVFTVPMHREISLSKDVLSLWRLWRVLRRIRPDLTIVGTPKAGLLGGMAAVLAGIPKRIYVFHGLRLETSAGWLRKVLVSCEWIACRCAHSVRCVSPSLMKRVIQLGIVRADKCHVVGKGTSNGIETERWRYTSGAAALGRQTREGLGIAVQAPVMGFVGRLTRDKGVIELYEAFTRVQHAYPDLCLLLVGDFEGGDPVPVDVRARIEADSSVICSGFVADVAPYLWTMDMLVLPTYREGFPGVPLEAQAASVPVITTDATGAIDAILDGYTGLRVPVGDAEALAAAMGQLLANPELRARMGQAGYQWVQQNFQRETVWSNLLGDYRSILEAAERRSQTGMIRLAKLGFDRLAAAMILIVTLPLWLGAAIAIRCSMGAPMFFRQVRPGYKGRPFTLFKLRTMLPAKDADGRSLPDADRLTLLGRFLRSASIDELPQLLNVLRGEMSLVGPRPLLMQYLDRYTSEQARRHDALPGITGWAQVNGRNAIGWEEKFSLDIWYVDHWSLLLDMRILIRTLGSVFQQRDISSQYHVTMPEFMGSKELEAKCIGSAS